MTSKTDHTNDCQQPTSLQPEPDLFEGGGGYMPYQVEVVDKAKLIKQRNAKRAKKLN